MANWEERCTIEAEATKISAEVELAKVNDPKLVDAVVRYKEAEAKDIASRADNRTFRTIMLTSAKVWQAVAVFAGRAALIHLIWGVVVVTCAYLIAVRMVGIMYGR